MLAVLGQKHWKPHSMDIRTAFLHGSELSRDIYVRPPPEANVDGIVWILRKCVYGLSDASLQWYRKVCEVVTQCGSKPSKVDLAVFYWSDNIGSVYGILSCHVDDFIWGGSTKFEQTVISTIRSSFNVGREEEKCFSYVGVEVFSSVNGITLEQRDYLDNLKTLGLDKSQMLQHQAALTSSQLEAYRSKIGKILWIARQARPDVLFDASMLASAQKNATVQNIIDANKVIRKLKAEQVALKFHFLGDENSLELVVFSGASLANLPDGGTQGGHFIALRGENEHFSPLSWQSKKIRRVVRSTLAGEALALSDGVDSAIYLATLHAELTTGQAKPGLPIVCLTDNHSLFDAVRSTKFVADKRLRLEISSLKEMIQRQQIKLIQWISAKIQLANCLTKRGASALNLLKALSDGVWHV